MNRIKINAELSPSLQKPISRVVPPTML